MTKTIEIKQANVKLTVFSSEESSFLVTSTIIEKEGHAFLINAKFTQSDAKEIVTYLNTNKLALDKIFVLHGDPDFYFGLETIKAAFPEAIAYATEATLDHIIHSVLGKVKFWSPTLGENAPTNVVLPKVFTEKSIDFQGLTFELVGLDPHRTSLFNKDLSLLLGGIDTFNEVHVFLADTKTKETMTAWISNLKALQALNPSVIVPSHGSLDKSFDSNLLTSTIAYLETAIIVSEESKDSADFVAKLDAAYPGFVNTGVLNLSAKVVMKEIPWG